MQVFLIGMMGSGKTFWAEKIAHANNMLHIDLDIYIEIKEKKKIQEIFEIYGEEYFRQLENKYLLEIILSKKSALISTGGGTPCFGNNLSAMLESGIVCYLKTDIKTLADRIKKDHSVRPLLKNIALENMESYFKNILLTREKYYLKASHIIEMNKINELTFAQNFKHEYC